MRQAAKTIRPLSSSLRGRNPDKDCGGGSAIGFYVASEEFLRPKGERVMSEVMTQGPKVILKFNESILKEIEITQPSFTIGRRPDNDLVIDHAAVSGRHARIVQVQSAFFLEDLRS